MLRQCFIVLRLGGQKSGLRAARMVSTVNEHETKRFGEWSEDWWDVNGPCKGLHLFNNLRIRFIREELLKTKAASEDAEQNKYPLSGITIADIGCGAGILSESLAKLGANVTGIDPTNEVILIAREHAALDPSLPSSDILKYESVTVDKHTQSHSGYYDAVVCSEVIEHVDEKEFFVEQCVKLVKKGGSLIFTTQNRTWWSWAAVILFTENITRNIPKGTHQYEMFITPQELQAILEKNGCSTLTLQGTSASPTLAKFRYVNHLRFCYALHVIKD